MGSARAWNEQVPFSKVWASQTEGLSEGHKVTFLFRIWAETTLMHPKDSSVRDFYVSSITNYLLVIYSISVSHPRFFLNKHPQRQECSPYICNPSLCQSVTKLLYSHRNKWHWTITAFSRPAPSHPCLNACFPVGSQPAFLWLFDLLCGMSACPPREGEKNRT
jgi:hypothetical protein